MRHLVPVCILCLAAILTPSDGEAHDIQNLLTVTGEAAGDRFGSAASGVGDVNADGYDDFIVGAYSNDALDTDSGRAYLYLGGPAHDGSPDLVFDSGDPAVGFFGFRVAPAGDVNGDTIDDFLITSWLYSAEGAAYLYYGGITPDATPDLIVTGSGNDILDAADGVGDVNGDGYDDFILGAQGNSDFGTGWGAAYLYFGGPDLDIVPDVTLGGFYGDFGFAVSGAGDLDGDGYDDVIVGAPENNDIGLDRGACYVYFGGSTFDSVEDLVLNGEENSDKFGRSVSDAGDVNGDGFADLIVGAYHNDAGGDRAGRAYIFYGGPGADDVPDVVFTGNGHWTFFGDTVNRAGDLNRDGFDDVMVGSCRNSVGGALAGTASVYFGGPNMDSVADLALHGKSPGDQFGSAVASAGDFNGDGIEDFVVGAEYNDANGVDSGRAYVYTSTPYTILSPVANVQWVAGQTETVRWRGPRRADLHLSTDGGSSWNVAAIRVGGDLVNAHSITAPEATELARVRLSFHGDTPTLSTSRATDGVFRVVAHSSPPGTAHLRKFVLSGEAASDGFGAHGSPAGDVNADGHPDFLVGATGADVNGSNDGKAYLYYGGPEWDDVPDLIFAGSNSGDNLGVSLAHADVNGDGAEDVLFGIPNSDVAGSNSGRIEVYFGGTAPDAVADLTFHGADANDELGRSLRGVGDINGNGADDFIAGAHRAEGGGTLRGQAHVYDGSFWGSPTPILTFTGDDDNDNLGTRVAPAGDVNNDGFADMLVATRATRELVHLYYGGPTADEIPDLILEGPNSGERFGVSIDGGQDVNGDGYADFVIAADGNDDVAPDAGCAYLYFGGPGLDDQPDAVIRGSYAFQNLGSRASFCGDLNADGYADLILSSLSIGTFGEETGTVHVYLGGPIVGTEPAFVFDGTEEGGFLGTAVAGLGDLDADGFDDLLVGTDLNEAYIHDFARYHLLQPGGGDIWSVGATKTVSWLGAEPANLWLSVDGGNEYDLLSAGIGGHESNEIGLVVPHRPGKFSRLRLSPSHPALVGSAESDSLFTIDASVILEVFQIGAPDGGESGTVLSWRTVPGPEELRGYKLERADRPSSWEVLVPLTRETRFSDPDGTAQARYRLTAINGLGEELIVGESSRALGDGASLAAWPQPFRSGSLHLRYASAGGIGGGSGPTRMTLHDTGGRLVRELVDEAHPAGYHEVEWDGEDRRGEAVSAGIYFIRLETGGEIRSMKLVVVR